MKIEIVKEKLRAHRAKGRREIPECIWRDAISLSQEKGVGAVGKLLGLNSVRIKYWADQFGIEIPSRSNRKPRAKNEVVRVAEVKIKNPEVMRVATEGRKILEIKAPNGMSLSFFESGSGEQFEKILDLVKGTL